MPLHEYEEKKRRQNIDALNARKACHICGSTSRNNKGFCHWIDHEQQQQQQGNDTRPQHHYNEMGTSLVPAPQTASMRTCACFNQSKSDPDYWPYSLRVCEMCIADDCTTGRIRNCGICGAVACDENCGVEMAECTDNPGWNNMGCLECRRFECFSQIDIFRTNTRAPDGTVVPRMTRVCVKCLEQCTPWVKYDFTCRLFKCNTRLVPSEIMERKRYKQFAGSPLNLLPEDGLANIVDFLPNSDLKSLYLTNSAMCTIAERVAETRVLEIHHEFPSGPLVVGSRKNPFGGKEQLPWIHCQGTNDFNVRAPEDGRVWVGILNYLEQITLESFYFGFQVTGSDGDADAVCRFMSRQDKFEFSQVYIKEGTNIVPRPEHPNSSDDGISIVSSHILITDATVKVPFTVASSQDLTTGTHRFICRLFCPGSGTKNATRDSMGSYGLLRKSQNEEGVQTIAWAKRLDIYEGYQREETVFGVEYNTETCELTVHFSRMNRYSSSTFSLDEENEGDLVFAIEVAAKAANVKDTMVSVRNCSGDEWTKFLEHTQDGEPVPAENAGDALDMIGIRGGLGNRRRDQEGDDNRGDRIRPRLEANGNAAPIVLDNPRGRRPLVIRFGFGRD